MKSLRWKIPIVVGAILFGCWFAFPLQERINLGLDLQGGMHLVLKVDTDKVKEEVVDISGLTEIAIGVLERRINGIGVREPVIQRQGKDHILIQLPGITDRERALSLIGQTALLEFQLVSDSQRQLERALDGNPPRGFRLGEGEDGTPYLLETDSTLTGAILADAFVQPGDYGLPEVNFRMNTEGARLFGRLTGSNLNRRLAIVLDGKVISAPEIRSRITDSGVISGRFTAEEAHDLAIVLRAGALPAPIVIEEERTVGPTLGRDSINAGIRAICLGAALVVVFMLIYYRLAGIIAIFALSLNLLLILGALGYLREATLTLPGIAGMLLTLGMAVDANVLIYERIREELNQKRPLGAAIRIGYEKAFSAIIDSNVTTLVAAFFLLYFGTGPIRGFATTLGIGILASLFTSLFVTRVLFDLLLKTTSLKHLSMMRLMSSTRIDFLKWRKICWFVSAAALIISAVVFAQRGEARYGIDFTGGLLQEYRFSKPVTAESLRETLAEAGVKGAIIQEYGSPTEWLIRSGQTDPDAINDTMNLISNAFAETYKDAAPDLLRVERVGPTVGKLLRRQASFAIIWSMLGILIYVAIRFRHLDFGVAALIALSHDVILATGALCLAQKEIDLVIVAALLTIAGYSVNDTIVIYDRVRENLRTDRKSSFKALLNTSINQMLSRTVLTTFTTLTVVIALFFVGGEVLHNFAFVLIIGFVTGVYSTIYIASSIVAFWRERSLKSKHA